ncbi:Uncharacterised protein [uncultured archaeon]|nr:Uncharacterised protein [uncultured archaeon]
MRQNSHFSVLSGTASSVSLNSTSTMNTILQGCSGMANYNFSAVSDNSFRILASDIDFGNFYNLLE